MISTTINFVKALNILAGIVKDFGADHIATLPDGGTGCVYFETDYEAVNPLDPTNLRPVCIIGQAFHRLGISRALLAGEHTQHEACNVGNAMWDNAEAMGVTFTREAQLFMRYVQSQQDSGEPWGDAVKKGVVAAQESFTREFTQQHEAFGWAVDEALANVAS